MIIRGNDFLEPEELTRLGKVFDEAWCAVGNAAGPEAIDQRTNLAFILFRLADLRQLGPDQMKATALRILRSEVAPPEAPRLSVPEPACCLAPDATAPPLVGS
jgi:hypothetical protein